MVSPPHAVMCNNSKLKPSNTSNGKEILVDDRKKVSWRKCIPTHNLKSNIFTMIKTLWKAKDK